MGVAPLSATARVSRSFRLSGNNFAPCSFERARTLDAAFAAAAVLVALLKLFDAAAFRTAVLAGFFAALNSWVMVLTLGLVRLRFEFFVTTFFILARITLLVLRATRVFDAGLLLLTRLRTLDEEAVLGARFDLAFALEAEAVFFVFAFVVFFDLLRAAIVNLSTRKLYRTRSKSMHEHCSKPVHEYCFSKRQVDFLPTRSPASSLRTPGASARRLICRLAQIRRKIKEEVNRRTQLSSRTVDLS